MSTTSSSSNDLRVPEPGAQDTRRRRGASEYLSLLQLDQGRTPAQRDPPCTRPPAADSSFTAPAGSRFLGNLIIPPLFKFGKSTSEEPSQANLPPRSFFGALLERFIPSRPAGRVGVVHIAKGDEGEDALGKTKDYLEERDRAQDFLDSYLSDCLKKNSSVYTPEEKMQMKRIQETLVREKQEEIVQREKTQRQGEAKGGNPRRQRAVKEQKVQEEYDHGTRPVKKTVSPERVEKDAFSSSLTLASELSREHPLFGRGFREKIRIYTKSGTEVNVEGEHSPRPRGDVNMAGDSRRERDDQKDDTRSSSSETESTTTEESRRSAVRPVERGDADAEISHSMIRESREILQKLQIDQAKEIQLNKMIIEENKRTLKKLQREKTRENLKELPPSPQEEKTTSKGTRKVKETKSSLEANAIDIRKTKNNKRHVFNDSDPNETSNAYRPKETETEDKVHCSHKVKCPLNGSDFQHGGMKDDSCNNINLSPIMNRKSIEERNGVQKETNGRKKSSKKKAMRDIEEDLKSTKIEVVYRNKNFLSVGKKDASPNLAEQMEKATRSKEYNNPRLRTDKKESSSRLHQEKHVRNNFEADRLCDIDTWKICSKDADLQERYIYDTERVKEKLKEISESECSSVVVKLSHKEKANKGVQCQTVKTRTKEIPVRDSESSRTTLELKSKDVAEKDYPAYSVTIRRPTRGMAECDGKSPGESNLKKSLDNTAKPVLNTEQFMEMVGEVENRLRPIERRLEKKLSDTFLHSVEPTRRDDDNIKSSKEPKGKTSSVEMDKESSCGFVDGGSAKQTDVQKTTEETRDSHLVSEGGHGVAPVLGYAITRRKKKKRSRVNSSENSTTSDSFLILCDGRTSRIGCVHNRLKTKQSLPSESTSSSGDSEEDTIEKRTNVCREQEKSSGQDMREDVTKKMKDLRQRDQKPRASKETTLKPVIDNKEVKKKYNLIMTDKDVNKTEDDDVDLYFQGSRVPDAIKKLFHHKEFKEIMKNSKDYHGMSTVMKTVIKKHPDPRSRKSHLVLMKKSPSYKHFSHSKDVSERSSKKTSCHEGDKLANNKMTLCRKVPSFIHETFPKVMNSKRNVVMHVETVGKVDVPPCCSPEKTKEDTRKELLDMLKSVHEKAEKLGRVRRVMEVIEERTDLDEKEKSHLLADMMVAVEKQKHGEGETQNQVGKKHIAGKEMVPVPMQDLCLYASEETREDADHLTDTRGKDDETIGTFITSPKSVKEKHGGFLAEHKMKQVNHTVMTTGIYQKQSIKHKITHANDTMINIGEDASSFRRNHTESSLTDEIGVQQGEKQVLGTFHDDRKTPKKVIVGRTNVYVKAVDEVTSNQIEHKQPQIEMHNTTKPCFDIRSKQMEEHMARVVAEYLSKKRQYESLKGEEVEEYSHNQQLEDFTMGHGCRKNIDQKTTKLVEQGINCAFRKPQTGIEKRDKLSQPALKEYYDIEDIEFMKKEVHDYIVKQSMNVSPKVQSDFQTIIESNKASKDEAIHKGSGELGDVRLGSKSKNITIRPSQTEGTKSKGVLTREQQDVENVMSLSHKNVKPLEFSGSSGGQSNGPKYQSETGPIERVLYNQDDNLTDNPKERLKIHVQERIIPAHEPHGISNIGTTTAVIPSTERFDHCVHNSSSCCPHNPLQIQNTQFVTGQHIVPDDGSYDSFRLPCHHAQQNYLGCQVERSEDNNSKCNCIIKKNEEAAHTMHNANKNDARIIEIQSDAKEPFQSNNPNFEGQDVLELMPHEGVRTSGYGDPTNVVSRIDSPDKAMQEIFKKMDDVIVNRFLTLASINGITIVVTPKLVVNEENQDGGDVKGSHEQQTPDETKIDVNRNEEVERKEDPEVCKENSGSNRKVYDIVVIDEKEETFSSEVNQNKPEVVLDHKAEGRTSGKMSGEYKCAEDKTQSITSKEQCEAEATGVPECKRSRLEAAASCSFNKKDVYFVSRTFCKSTGAIRKEKKLQMRLRRGRATRTRNRSWRGSGTNDRRHQEPILPDHQASVTPADHQQVPEPKTSGATSAPEGGPSLVPEDIRILEEITFINVSDTKLKNYDRCYEELLNCSSMEEQQVGSSNCVQDGAIVFGAVGDKGSNKRKEKPVDSFLERMRKSLDEDELRMLEESSRTSSVGPFSGNEFEVIYVRGPGRPSDTSVSTASHIRTIEDIISDADNEDRQLSICECFGVTNINDLLDSLGAGKAKARGPSGLRGRVRGMRSNPVTSVKGEVPLRSASDVTVTPEVVSLATNTSLPPPGPVRKPSRQNRRYQDKDIKEWMRDGAMFHRHDGTLTDDSMATSKEVRTRQQREESAGRVKDKRMQKISGVPLSEFVRNYALKSGIILGRSLEATAHARDGDGYETSATEDTNDCVNVKIELTGGARTDIVIQMPEVTSLPRTPELSLTPPPRTAEQAMVTSSSTPPRSRAQIVHVDSEEIVLTTETPEAAAWTEREEREFERALKKHRPRPNVWDRIARTVGRSKRECVLHFLDIWRKLDSAGE